MAKCVATTAGLDYVTTKETDVKEYSRLQDKVQKSELRQPVRDEFLPLDVVGRARWKRAAEEEIARLLPPHHPFEEWKGRRK